MRIKTALRNINRHRLNSSIIIISLGIGIACINLIAIFIFKEYNADSFQRNKKQIYALNCIDPWKKESKIYYTRFGAAEYMKNNFSEVKDFCRITNANPIKVIVDHQDFFGDPKVILASSNFFEFFSYPLLMNTPNNVLTTNQDVVISQELASKYFGSSDPVGQHITLVNRNDRNEMVVSGVFKKPVESTQLNFDMVRMIGENDSRCYLLLAENTNIHQLEEKFLKNKMSIPIINDGTPGSYFLTDMHAAYFDPLRGQSFERNRNKTDLIVALIIALMILIVALFNYLGLLNNRLIDKYKEHSIRKVIGGSKMNLITDFINDTLILNIIAFILSIIIMIGTIPFFNQVTNSALTITYLLKFKNLMLLLGIPTLVQFTTYLFVSFRIRNGIQIETLKSDKRQPIGRANFPFFNIAQLAISVILIVGSLVILKQINYINNKKIGLNKEVIEVKIPQQNMNLATIFKTELEKNPSVEIVSLANASPLLEHFMLLLKYQDNGTEQQYTPSVFVGDQNYIKALGVTLVDGEDFSEDVQSNKNKCIINESLSKLFPGQNLIGKELPGNKGTVVIGIAKDFHYGSLKHFIEPGYIGFGDKGFYLMVKPAKGQTVQTKELISKTWNKLITDYPLNMESIGEQYEEMHRENSNYVKLIGACCLISIFLSMIGLFSISFHTSKRRIKEIGIRKVNGAKTSEVMVLLNQDFVKWVAVAFIVATPVAWYVMYRWLENFAYKTELNWWIFALAGLLALFIALLTVSFQSWQTATRNPVESLRDE